jgi:hypothetical protein
MLVMYCPMVEDWVRPRTRRLRSDPVLAALIGARSALAVAITFTIVPVGWLIVK